MNQKGFVNIILIMVVVVLAGAGLYFALNRQTTPQVPTPIPELTPKPPSISSINNFEECVKAGYPTGRSLPEKWERCWTPDFRIFMKGLKPTIRQGVYGKVTLITGNCMPVTVGSERTNGCKELSVEREIYIMAPVTRDVVKNSYLVAEPNPIKLIKSQQGGFYEAELPVATYSIFVEDSGKKYCGSVGSKDEACQVTIVEGGIREYNVKIDRAVY